MTQGISDRFWQAEAKGEQTKQLIRDIKRITRRKFTAEEKIRVVLEGFRRDTLIKSWSVARSPKLYHNGTGV